MADRICSIPDCDKPSDSRGWCKAHYYRWGRYGDPLGSAPPRSPKVRQACTVDGCESPQYGRGWCENHYARWRRHGALHDKRAERSDPAERFWARVDKSNADGCWLWTGPLNSSGYGSCSYEGRPRGAHVVAVLLDGRDVPDGMEVDHVVCDNPPCVRASHLRVTTREINWRRSSSLPAQYARATHCTHGHEFTESNTYRTRNGGRSCRACAAAYQRSRRGAQGALTA